VRWDRTIAQVAKDLDLTETALREWVKRAEVDAGKGPVGALTTEEREELTRLRRENKRLQMEREILKNSRSGNGRVSRSAAQMKPPTCLGHRRVDGPVFVGEAAVRVDGDRRIARER